MGAFCLDAGHGGDQPGACYGGIQEKDINLIYMLALNAELKRRQHQVLTTRTDDENVPPLISRCRLINEHHKTNSPKFDAIVSLHCNAAVGRDQVSPLPECRGLYAIYSCESVASTALAQALVDRCKAAGIVLNHHGMMSTIELGRSLTWIHQTLPPAVLVELGFMTNPDELARLQRQDYPIQLAELIADGLEDFLANC